MAYVTDHLNIPIHIFQFMNNAIAGGQINPTDLGGTNTTGGFGVSTGSNDARCTVTWSAYSGTPIIVACPVGTGTGASNDSWVNPFGIGVSSAGLVFAAHTNSGGSAATANFPAMVYVFGANTGTRIS